MDTFLIITCTETPRRKKTLDIHNYNEKTLLVLCIELTKSTTGTLLEFM